MAMGAGMAPADKQPKADTRTQAQEFEDTAREHRANDDRLKGVLRIIAGHKPAATPALKRLDKRAAKAVP